MHSEDAPEGLTSHKTGWVQNALLPIKQGGSKMLYFPQNRGDPECFTSHKTGWIQNALLLIKQGESKMLYSP